MRVASPFPNFTQIPARVPTRVWNVLRTVSVLGAFALVVLLFVRPSAGLTLFWKVVIPTLPLIFFIAPGFWRNTCPLAASNQIPRLFGFTRGLTAPDWFRRYAYIVGIALFMLAVPTRIALFNENGPATGLLLLAALAGGFGGGLLFKGKSGWCSSICPLLPVQRIYGQTPYLLLPNNYCQPCVGCAKNCYDFNPRVAYLADLHDEDPQYADYRKFFVGTFPGLIVAFFTLPKPPAVSVPEVYLRFLLYIVVSAGSFYLIQSFVRTSAHHLTTVYAMAALNLFYYWAMPVVVATVLSPLKIAVSDVNALAWTLRLVLAILSAAWIWRTYHKESLFLAQSQSAVSLRVGAGRAQLLQQGGRPEVTLMPAEKVIAVEPRRSLLEVIESSGLSIESGCRMGICGADPVGILDGADHLSAVADDELSTLERLGLESSTRLACVARVLGNCTVSLTPGQRSQKAPESTMILAVRFDPNVDKVVVIGNGIAGVTAADYVRRRHPACHIDLIARENHHLYNRMGIERLIYGRSAMQGLYLLPEDWYEEHAITTWLNTRALRIDPERRQVVLGTGESLNYDRLILATGSASTIPPIEGVSMPGSFVLRDADDALAIRGYAQQHGARRAVVAGAGLLGLEAAHALRRLGLEVSVLERSDALLRRQLDERASEFLREYLEGLGLEIVLRADTVALEGDGRVREVRLKDGRALPCDLFLVAAGISPHVELARAAGIKVNRGVVVDDYMRTSVPEIFAAGDVAEHRGQIQGLWPTAVAQAKVAALNAVSGSRVFEGIVPVTILKVAGVDLTSIGRIAAESPEEIEIALEETHAHRYRKLVIAEGRIAGAILLGYAVDAATVRDAITNRVDVRSVLDALRAGDWSVLNTLLDAAHAVPV